MEVQPPALMIDNGYGNPFYGWRPRFACRFLVRYQGKYYCTIHAVKPLTCQLFPFKVCKNGFLHIRKDAKEYRKYLPECFKNEPNCLDSLPLKEQSALQAELEEIKECICKFLNYVKRNPSLKRKTDLLDNIHCNPYRIFITSTVGISILRACVKGQYENIKLILKKRNARLLF